MIEYIKNLICPANKQVVTLNQAVKDIVYTNELSRLRVQKLEDTLAQRKSDLTTTVDKMSVTNHSIFRYRERHNGQGSDEDIRKMLYKALLQQLTTTDTLQDGKISIRKGIYGVVKDHSLVTILPRHATKQIS